jgi:hypothetical protein
MQELTNAEFLSLLRHRNINVSARDGRLRINAPAGVLDAPLRAELTRRKSDLLRLIRSADARSLPGPLAPARRTEKIPQTHAQQGLWLIDHFDPGHVAYNIPEAFFVEEPIDRQALQRAVDQLLSRHETLRTSFYEEEGELFQAIAPAAHAPVEFTDLSMLAASDRDQALYTLIREQAGRPFDLSQPPLIRFHLFRLAEQRHAIFFNIHHIIADRRSLTILCEELDVLYQAVVRNETAHLPVLPIQYADYAIWTAQQLADDAIEKQLRYWSTKLAEVPEYMDLHGSRVYPEKRAPWAATTPVVISAALRDSLSSVAQQENATLFMTLMAAFAVLLYRHSGKEDFCIGSPITHRKQVETEHLIGLFVNMLVFRCQMDGDPSFRDVLRRVRTNALEAYENSDVPFQELVRVLKPDPRSLRSPFFQVMFGFDSDMAAKPSSFLHIDTKPGTARFDLILQLSESPHGISGSFEYCTDLFDEPMIVQLANEFVALLGTISANPDQSISGLETHPPVADGVTGSNTSEQTPPKSWKEIVQRLAERLTRRD